MKNKKGAIGLKNDVKWLIKGEKRIMKILAEAAINAAKQDADIKARQEKLEADIRAREIERAAEISKLDAEIKTKDAEIKERHEKSYAELKESIAETEMFVKEMSKEGKKLQRLFGNSQNNHGKRTEDYFFNSLSLTLEFAGIKFDQIIRNSFAKNKETSAEFDILLLNGSYVVLIECKQNAHESDLDKLEHKKLIQFRQLYPNYSHCKVFLALASFSFYPQIEAMASERGIALLKQVGNVMKVEMDNLKAF